MFIILEASVHGCPASLLMCCVRHFTVGEIHSKPNISVHTPGNKYQVGRAGADALSLIVVFKGKKTFKTTSALTECLTSQWGYG